MTFEDTALRATAIGLRVGGAFVFLPFFGSPVIPARIKAVLVVLCTALLYPATRVAAIPASAAGMVELAGGELLLGLLIGLCLQFAFEAAQLAGQIAGFQLSFSLVNVIDPQSSVDTPVLANFQQLAAMWLFLQMNVHHWVLRAMEQSFERVPPGSVVFGAAHVHALFQAANGMWIAGLQLAAPLLLATVLLDVTVGLVSKAAPQMPVLVLSIPLKSLLGYAVLGMALGLWPAFFEKQFGQALDWSWHMVALLQTK